MYAGVPSLKGTNSYLLLDKMKINLHMLGALMLNGVGE
jgi:hypothetical protein